MKSFKAQRGLTLTEMAVVLVFAALYLSLTLGATNSFQVASSQKDELRQFLDTGFLSLKVRYQEYLRNNGYCFTSDPPDYTYADLQADYGLMPDVNTVWFDALGAVYKIDPNAVTGAVDQYQILITLPAGGVDDGGFEVHPYFRDKVTQPDSSVIYRYTTPHAIDKGHRTAYSTDNNLCVI